MLTRVSVNLLVVVCCLFQSVTLTCKLLDGNGALECEIIAQNCVQTGDIVDKLNYLKELLEKYDWKSDDLHQFIPMEFFSGGYIL